MSEQITIENLQQEVAALKVEKEGLQEKIAALEKSVEELKTSKDYWYKSYESEEKRSQKLKDSLIGLRAIIDGIVNQ